MKQMILLAILFFGIISNSNSKIKVYGKITGFDGKPTIIAHIAKFGDDTFAPITTADAEGNYSLFVDNTGKNSLAYFGTYHLVKNVKFYIPENMNEINIDVQLSPITIDDPSKVRLIGDFNSFQFDSTAVPFTYKDGKYSTVVPNTADTLKYQLLYEFSAKDGARSFNGSQADFFIKDGKSDFISAIVSKEKSVQIIFDSTKYSNSIIQASVKSKDSLTTKCLNLFVDCDKLKKSFQYDIQQQMMKKNWDSMHIVKLNYIDLLLAKFGDEKDSLIRALSYLYLFDIASYGGITKALEDKDLSTYSKELINIFDAKSNLWQGYYNMFEVIQAIENPYHSKYYQSMMTNHPNQDVRDLALFKLLFFTKIEKYSKYKDEYFEKYKAQFPDGKYIKTVMREFSPERAIDIGKMIPDFILPRLENLKDSISAKDLLGKYTLIDVWGTWCAPCRVEMPHLDSAFSMFKDKNFNIMSIAFDNSPSTVQKFREGKWKMPWTHTFATGLYENSIADIFQISGVPTVFLIDPKGKIIETDESLKRENLIPTLQKYFK